MGSMKEMAAEYRLAAAKLAMSIEKHKGLNDLSPCEMHALLRTLRDIRATGYLLSGYYELPRPHNGLTIHGMAARRLRSNGSEDDR